MRPATTPEPACKRGDVQWEAHDFARVFAVPGLSRCLRCGYEVRERPRFVVEVREVGEEVEVRVPVAALRPAVTAALLLQADREARGLGCADHEARHWREAVGAALAEAGAALGVVLVPRFHEERDERAGVTVVEAPPRSRGVTEPVVVRVSDDELVDFAVVTGDQPEWVTDAVFCALARATADRSGRPWRTRVREAMAVVGTARGVRMFPEFERRRGYPTRRG